MVRVAGRIELRPGLFLFQSGPGYHAQRIVDALTVPPRAGGIAERRTVQAIELPVAYATGGGFQLFGAKTMPYFVGT